MLMTPNYLLELSTYSEGACRIAIGFKWTMYVFYWSTLIILLCTLVANCNPHFGYTVANIHEEVEKHKNLIRSCI